MVYWTLGVVSIPQACSIVRVWASVMGLHCSSRLKPSGLALGFLGLGSLLWTVEEEWPGPLFWSRVLLLSEASLEACWGDIVERVRLLGQDKTGYKKLCGVGRLCGRA